MSSTGSSLVVEIVYSLQRGVAGVEARYVELAPGRLLSVSNEASDYSPAQRVALNLNILGQSKSPAAMSRPLSKINRADLKCEELIIC